MNIPPTSSTSEAFFAGFLSGEIATNPFPLLAQARAIGALIPVPSMMGGTSRQAWLVTRWEEAVRILKDYKQFTVDPSTIGTEGVFRRRAVNSSGGSVLFEKSLITVDEPDHRRLRDLVSKAFTPKYIQGLRPRIQQIADELLDAVQGQGMMDVVRDFAYPLPINVISEMFGVPAEDRAHLREWSNAIAGGIGTGLQNEEDRNKARAFSAYIAQLVADKRRHPQDDLTSQLIQMEEEGDRLSEHELLSMLALLVFAGHETTSNLIAIGTLLLLDHPDQLEKLKADLSLVSTAVEELLRFSGSVIMPFPRFATQDIEIGGQYVQQGDLLFIALPSVNRDEAQFTQPEELDIARQLNRHIAFGQGIHVCLGAPLARLEGYIAFTTLLRRMPNLRLNVPRDTLTWRFSSNLRGLNSLPISF